MEDQNQQPVATQDNPVENQENKNDSVAYDSYKKLLSEKKSVQAKAREMEERLKFLEQEKQQAEGNKDDVINSLRKELNETKDTLNKTKRTYAYTSIEDQIKAKATQEGCVDPSALVRLLDSEDVKSVDVGDDFRVNSDDLARLIDKAKKQTEHIGLFKKKDIQVHDVKTPYRPASKGIDDMSTDELKELARQTLS